MENQKLLTVKEVAQLLNVAESTIKSSSIPRIKLGRKLLFIESDIQQWIVEQTRTTGKKQKRTKKAMSEGTTETKDNKKNEGTK